jgi:hypothetical protein
MRILPYKSVVVKLQMVVLLPKTEEFVANWSEGCALAGKGGWPARLASALGT